MFSVMIGSTVQHIQSDYSWELSSGCVQANDPLCMWTQSYATIMAMLHIVLSTQSLCLNEYQPPLNSVSVRDVEYIK